jgi:hypothetical protein
VTLQLSHIITNPATGRISMTKLAGATAHINAAAWFAILTARHGFILDLWVIYLGATIVHNGWDKAVATYRDHTLPARSSAAPQEPPV